MTFSFYQITSSLPLLSLTFLCWFNLGSSSLLADKMLLYSNFFPAKCTLMQCCDVVVDNNKRSSSSNGTYHFFLKSHLHFLQPQLLLLLQKNVTSWFVVSSSASASSLVYYPPYTTGAHITLTREFFSSVYYQIAQVIRLQLLSSLSSLYQLINVYLHIN